MAHRERRSLVGIAVTVAWLLAGCAWSALIAAPAAAAEGPAPIRVGVFENEPKIYLDQQNRPAGLFVTLIRAIARDQGWTLQFVPCQWPQCLEALARGDIDLLPDVAFSEVRDQRFEFHAIPVARSWSVLLVPEPSAVRQLADLNQQRIALLERSVQVQQVRELMARHGLVYDALTYQSFAAAFEAVRQGEADAVAVNRFYADAFAARAGLRETADSFGSSALYFATAAGDPRGLLPVIDRHLAAWRFDPDSVYYTALREAQIPARKPSLPARIRYLLAGAALLLVVVIGLALLFRHQVRRRTAQLSATAQRLDHLVSASPAVLYQLSVDDGQVQTRWISDNAQRLFDFDPEDFVRLDRWRRQLHPEDRETVLNNLAVLPQREHLVQEYRIYDGAGSVRFVRDEMRFVQGVPGQADEIVGSWSDLTETQAQAARLSFLTHYDALTGLPNRALFNERLEHAVYRARRERRTMALLYLGIDRFKTINESFGYSAGDRVLKAVSDRVVHAVDATDVVARIGGDGFVLLLTGDTSRQNATTVARKLMRRFVDPVQFDGHELQLTLSVGISMFPGDAEDAETLLRNAESALFNAKHSGRNAYRLYSSTLAAGHAARLALERGLRGAVARREMVLYYQPQLDLHSRELVAAEALLRWQHPELGLVSPGRFIPLAEEMGIISELGAWVIGAACLQLKDWRAQGWTMPRVSVNLSVQQIDSDTLVPLLRTCLNEAGLPPACLELEVTESMIMREPARAASTLRRIRDMGIPVAIDDFGTGYSSLNYLKHLPIDRLKIDRSFVRDLGVDSNSEAISRAVIGLARSLDLEVVAEGIETEAQLQFLRQEGCHFGQGYLFSTPVPSAQLLRDWGPGPAN